MRNLVIFCIYCMAAIPAKSLTAQQSGGTVSSDPEIKLITICQNFEGHGYYLSGSFVVMQEEQGWYEDTLQDRPIMLAEINGKPVIMYEDISGETKSAVEDGALSFYVADPEGGNLLVGVVYPKNLIESYLFNLNDNGLGVVLWTTTRSNGLMDTARVMKGHCYLPDEDG